MIEIGSVDSSGNVFCRINGESVYPSISIDVLNALADMSESDVDELIETANRMFHGARVQHRKQVNGYTKADH